MRKMLIAATVALFFAIPATPTFAQDYLSDFKTDFAGSSQKLLDLAGAVPADLYTWRPAEGIRSVSEVYMHVAVANYYFASLFGVAPPAGFSPDMEQSTTAKDDVIAALKMSQDHIKQAVENAASMDLNEQIDVFGGKQSRRAVLMIVAGHSHEHLGQSIAYARSNNVAPPWSGGD